jgi:hypothetical protein
MHTAFSGCGPGRQARIRCFGATVALPALVATFISVSLAEAATCLASAEEVRKATPNAWPKWTYGPNRERCWYAGKKPVFEKPPKAQAQAQHARAPQATTEAAPQATVEVPEAERRSAEPVERAWALEYRWSGAFGIRHQANDQSLEPWVGDPDADSQVNGRLLPPKQ